MAKYDFARMRKRAVVKLSVNFYEKFKKKRIKKNLVYKRVGGAYIPANLHDVFSRPSSCLISQPRCLTLMPLPRTRLAALSTTKMSLLREWTGEKAKKTFRS